ncbi:STAS domain-containing protein [Marinobacterium litorale]|uniref:STAS domain-containing protein n=1 Tax=Marinobacterium litorale TaxID=404770 RepID=UPI0003F5D4B5|nr:STAS domain-containing protein [Marinobacterium litorale]
MSLDITKVDNVGYVTVDDELTIYTAAMHAEKLFAWAREFRSLKLDLNKVSEIDCAGVQLLLLLKNEVAHQHGKLELVSPNEAVSRVLTLLRLSERLAVTEESSSEGVSHG